MHGLLQKLLQKKGINKVEELSREEKDTFDNYRRILSKENLTIEDIQKFLESQIAVIEGKWVDLNLEQNKKAELIPYHTTYKLLLRAIQSPKAEKEALEQILLQQLNN